MHSRRTEDGRAESEVAERDSPPRRERGRHVAQAPDHVDGPRARHGLLQHSGYRVARGEEAFGAKACKTGSRESVSRCLDDAAPTIFHTDESELRSVVAGDRLAK